MTDIHNFLCHFLINVPFFAESRVVCPSEISKKTANVMPNLKREYYGVHLAKKESVLLCETNTVSKPYVYFNENKLFCEDVGSFEQFCQLINCLKKYQKGPLRMRGRAKWYSRQIQNCHNTRFNKGLPNFGATCFANAILSVLLRTPFFWRFFWKRGKDARGLVRLHKLPCPDSLYDQKIVGYLRGFFVDFSQRHHISFREQQDAHEFLMLLMEDIEKSSSKIAFRNTFCTQIVRTFICGECGFKDASNKSQSSSIHIEKIEAVDLEEILNSLYENREKIRRKCPKCNLTCDAVMRDVVEKTPEILIISLNRFSYTPNGIAKNTTSVRASDIMGFQGSLYKRYGACLHIGSINNGHYIGIVRDMCSNAWSLFDDDKVKEVDMPLQSPYSSYIEFYRKLNSS